MVTCVGEQSATSVDEHPRTLPPQLPFPCDAVKETENGCTCHSTRKGQRPPHWGEAWRRRAPHKGDHKSRHAAHTKEMRCVGGPENKTARLEPKWIHACMHARMHAFLHSDRDTTQATRSTARRVSPGCLSTVGCSRFSNELLLRQGGQERLSPRSSSAVLRPSSRRACPPLLFSQGLWTRWSWRVASLLRWPG